MALRDEIKDRKKKTLKNKKGVEIKVAYVKSPASCRTHGLR
jgi:hypothetical protein